MCGAQKNSYVDKQLEEKRKPNAILPVQNVRKDKGAHWPIFQATESATKSRGVKKFQK